MDIAVTGPSELTLSGQIQTLEDYMLIKKTIAAMGSLESLTIKIPDSAFLGSAVLGYFLVLTREKNVKLTLLVRNDKLVRHLTVLQLLSEFKVKGF